MVGTALALALHALSSRAERIVSENDLPKSLGYAIGSQILLQTVVCRMKKSIPILAVLLTFFAWSGCLTASLRYPQGHYSSNDDFGVFIFCPDGVFGYKFAAMFDFFDQNNLPPERGHWNLKSDGTLEIHLDDSGARKFRIEWHPEENYFDLIRLEADGTLPMKAHYAKKKN